MEVAEDNENGGGESSSSMVPRSATLDPPLPPLPPPPRITYAPLDARSLPDLRALNSALFPISYGPRVYEQALAAGGISHGAFFDGEELVGAITVRLEAGTAASATAAPAASLFVGEEGGEEEKNDSESLDGGLARMYVMTVGVLSPWRGKGIGEFFFRFLLSRGSARETRERGWVALTFSHFTSPKQKTPKPLPPALSLSLFSPLSLQERRSSPTPSRWPQPTAGWESPTCTRTSPTPTPSPFTLKNWVFGAGRRRGGTTGG